MLTVNAVEVQKHRLRGPVGYTVVGNPTIVDGVVSGFSSSDYIVTTTDVNWLQVTEIVVKINIPSAALNQSRYMSAMYGGMQLFVYSATSNFQYCGFNANGIGDLMVQHNLAPDKDYWIKYTSDGTNSTVWWSEDGLNYTTGQTKLTSTITSYPGSVRFGSNNDINNRYFGGSIDLNETYIKVNGKLWFYQPADTKYIVKDGKLVWADPRLALSGPVGYEVVGSPSIVDGIASGFSASAYLETDENFSTENMLNLNCEFFAKITPAGYNDHECYAIRYYNNGILRGLGLDYDKLCFCPGYPVSGGQAERITSTFSVTYGTTYYLKGVIVGKVASLYYSLDNKNYELIGSIDYTGNTFSVTDGFKFGADNTAYGTFDGSIDFNETYIKVNDQLWFYGKNYATQNIAPVPAGYTYGTTTTPSIGYVDMRTQQFTAAPSGAAIGRDE